MRVCRRGWIQGALTPFRLGVQKTTCIVETQHLAAILMLRCSGENLTTPTVQLVGTWDLTSIVSSIDLLIEMQM